MRFLKLILSFSIIGTAFLGDYVVFKSKYSSSQLFRAVADSLVHGSIGFLSAVLFFCNDTQITSVFYIVFCTLLSSFIDVDHAVAAKSIYLKDMLNLQQRGVLHCTSLWLAISTILLVYSYYMKKLNVLILTFMVIIAYSSHHIRDGNRRGLWMYPFGHTMAINKYLYVISLAILPHVYWYLYKGFEPKLFKNSIVDIDYRMIV